MISQEEMMKIELIRQKNLKRIDRQRKFRDFQPDRFNEFEFAKSIGFDKAIQQIMQALGFNKSDVNKLIEFE